MAVWSPHVLLEARWGPPTSGWAAAMSKGVGHPERRAWEKCFYVRLTSRGPVEPYGRWPIPTRIVAGPGPSQWCSEELRLKGVPLLGV